MFIIIILIRSITPIILFKKYKVTFLVVNSLILMLKKYFKTYLIILNTENRFKVINILNS